MTTPSIKPDAQRMQHLENLLKEANDILREYEGELLITTDPMARRRQKLAVEKIQDSIDNFKTQLNRIQSHLADVEILIAERDAIKRLRNKFARAAFDADRYIEIPDDLVEALRDTRRAIQLNGILTENYPSTQYFISIRQSIKIMEEDLFRAIPGLRHKDPSQRNYALIPQPLWKKIEGQRELIQIELQKVDERIIELDGKIAEAKS